MAANKEVGFVGLGIMGKPMARNLMKAGYALTVHDIVATAMEEVVTDGARQAVTSREVAERASVVITMVPDSADSEAAILGPDGVLRGASEGSVVIDMSSIAPATSKRIATACEAEGVDFLDAPVSGGETGAIAGTLAIMVGGKEAVFERHRELLGAMGGNVTHCGGYGAGCVTKLANQIIVAANLEAISEALVLVKKAGLDPKVVFEAIKEGSAASAMLTSKAPTMISGDFTPGFRVELHHKDLHNTLLTGKELGVPLPVTSLVQQMLTALVSGGKGKWDHSALVTLVGDMAGTSLSDR